MKKKEKKKKEMQDTWLVGNDMKMTNALDLIRKLGSIKHIFYPYFNTGGGPNAANLETIISPFFISRHSNQGCYVLNYVCY